MTNKLAQFPNEKYLNLETYGKDGRAIRTPMWFVEDNGVLYLRTHANYGKVRRIRRNPHVRLVPSDAFGKPKGQWAEGYAQLADPAESRRLRHLFDRKYGWEKTWFDLLAKLRRHSWVFITIRM